MSAARYHGHMIGPHQLMKGIAFERTGVRHAVETWSHQFPRSPSAPLGAAIIALTVLAYQL
jgi:hypothetical protein